LLGLGGEKIARSGEQGGREGLGECRAGL